MSIPWFKSSLASSISSATNGSLAVPSLLVPSWALGFLAKCEQRDNAIPYIWSTKVKSLTDSIWGSSSSFSFETSSSTHPAHWPLFELPWTSKAWYMLRYLLKNPLMVDRLLSISWHRSEYPSFCSLSRSCRFTERTARPRSWRSCKSVNFSGISYQETIWCAWREISLRNNIVGFRSDSMDLGVGYNFREDIILPFLIPTLLLAKKPLRFGKLLSALPEMWELEEDETPNEPSPEMCISGWEASFVSSKSRGITSGSSKSSAEGGVKQLI